jgi:hypothetical protein
LVISLIFCFARGEYLIQFLELLHILLLPMPGTLHKKSLPFRGGFSLLINTNLIDPAVAFDPEESHHHSSACLIGSWQPYCPEGIPVS